MFSQTYSRPMIFMHWLTALLVATAFVLIWSSEVEDKVLHQQIVSWHKAIGITVLALTILRLMLRLGSQLPAAIETSALQAKAARIGHAGLYLLLLGTPVIGWFMSSAAGYPVNWFGFFELPLLMSPDKPTAKLLHGLHENVGTLMFILIGVHALAAIWHHRVLKDGTLRRMLP